MIRRRKSAVVAQIAEASVCLGPPGADSLGIGSYGRSGRLVALSKRAMLVSVVGLLDGGEALGRARGDGAGKGEAMAIRVSVVVDVARLWIWVVLGRRLLGLGRCAGLVLLARGAGRVGGGLVEVRQALHEAREGPLARLTFFAHGSVVWDCNCGGGRGKQAGRGSIAIAMAVLESELVHLPFGLEVGSAVAIPLR